MAKTNHRTTKKAATAVAAAPDGASFDDRTPVEDKELSEFRHNIGRLFGPTGLLGGGLLGAARPRAMPTYRSSPTKSGRRTKADIQAIRDALGI